MTAHECQPSSGKACPESAACAIRLKLCGVAISLALSFIMGIVGMLGRCEALVAAGFYAFYQGFICGKSVLAADDGNLPQSAARCWFVSLLAGFIVALGALDVLIFSVVRLVKASRGLLVEPSPWALMVAALAILGNSQLSYYSACVARQQGGRHLDGLRRSFQTSIFIAIVVFLGDMVGQWWPAADDLAAIIVVGMLVKPVMELCLKRPEKTP